MTPAQLDRAAQDGGAPLRRFCEFYDTFAPPWLDRLGEIYAPDFEFHDPFHDFSGDMKRLREYFEKPLQLAHSKFLVEDAAIGQDGCIVRWTWEWKWKPKSPMKTVPGVTHIRFGEGGRVIYHRDMFDAASGFFDIVPVLGWMIRFVKKRL